MKVRISKTMAAEFADANKTLQNQDGYMAYPDTVGEHELVPVQLFRIRGFCEERLKHTPSPTMRTAYNALRLQIDNTILLEELKRDGKIKPMNEVSQRNNSEGQFITLARSEILTLDQVRTVFDDTSIAELAEDIKNHGLINPITVRHGHEGKYFLVAGERRLRACELAGVPIVAKVINADAAAGKRIQLAENIHREDLCLEDKARAVRELYDQLGTMQAVADLVKKSKAWVSKHVAVTEPDFGWRARKLLEDGTCEDLELLGTLSKIEHTCNWSDSEEAIKRFLEGGLNREAAREFLRSRGED